MKQMELDLCPIEHPLTCPRCGYHDDADCFDGVEFEGKCKYGWHLHYECLCCGLIFDPTPCVDCAALVKKFMASADSASPSTAEAKTQ